MPEGQDAILHVAEEVGGRDHPQGSTDGQVLVPPGHIELIFLF